MWAKGFDPAAAARRAVDAARREVGDRLSSATLYGSAAGGEFDQRTSDVNVALVLTALGPAELEALRGAYRTWIRLRVTRPLLLSRETLARSIDAFPLEYLLIRHRHETLYGADPFAAIRIDRAALRTAVERVLRTQELGLNASYLALAGSPSGARHWALRASTAITASASGLLYLMGEPIPASRSELADRCAARLAADPAALSLLLARGSTRVEAGRLLESAQSLLTRLIEAAEKLDERAAPP
jgi:hypothetical protein